LEADFGFRPEASEELPLGLKSGFFCTMSAIQFRRQRETLPLLEDESLPGDGRAW
jgi:hypothetical protein